MEGYGAGGIALRQAVRMSDLGAIRKVCKEAADSKDAGALLEKGDTFRAWTPLHIAAWGNVKDPKKCKDVIELLLQTAKKLDKEKELLKVEASDKATALDLAKERKEQLMQQRTDEPDAIESRKNLEKVIEWLDQGLPPE